MIILSRIECRKLTSPDTIARAPVQVYVHCKVLWCLYLICNLLRYAVAEWEDYFVNNIKSNHINRNRYYFLSYVDYLLSCITIILTRNAVECCCKVSERSLSKHIERRKADWIGHIMSRNVVQKLMENWEAKEVNIGGNLLYGEVKETSQDGAVIVSASPCRYTG